MGYQIRYRKERGRQFGRIPVFTMGFFLLFLAGLLAVHQPTVFWPKSLDTLAVVIQDSGIREAIECFCMELTGNG